MLFFFIEIQYIILVSGIQHNDSTYTYCRMLTIISLVNTYHQNTRQIILFELRKSTRFYFGAASSLFIFLIVNISDCLSVYLLKREASPGWEAWLVRASSQYAKVLGSVPSQDTYKNQPMSTSMSGTTN